MVAAPQRVVVGALRDMDNATRSLHITFKIGWSLVPRWNSTLLESAVVRRVSEEVQVSTQVTSNELGSPIYIY